ncbi:MAG: hypothetical protein Q9M43_06500 [Sulfurimonas sp.]|nr:hypothetical protein [Sulfurimonas sp.]
MSTLQFILLMLVLLSTLFANESLESIYEHILIKNTQKAILASTQMQSDIKSDKLEMLANDFAKLVQTFKTIESFYILGDLDDNYLDTPRYMDTFHQGNEDIKVQLDLILNSDEDLSVSLYKNSHKTINALEYILFKKDLKKQRVKKNSINYYKKYTNKSR